MNNPKLQSVLDTLHSDGIKPALDQLSEAGDYTREIRKFAIWCARQVQHLMSDPRSIQALDVSEMHGYGFASDQELSAAREELWRAYSAADAADAAADAADAADAAADAAAYAAYAAARAADAAYAAAAAAAAAAYAAAADAAAADAYAADAARAAAGNIDAAKQAQVRMLEQIVLKLDLNV